MFTTAQYKNVIIVYENIVREYDNALLLKAELENRGYKVELVFKNTDVLFKHRAAVVILPNCYNTEDLESYLYYLNANGSIFIDLQYEQVLSKRIEKIGRHNPKGKAKNIYHFCWGENNYKRLLENGIDSGKLRICGALQLDFLRPEFQEFYLSRQEIGQRYNLDVRKKWLLYISSFSYVNNSTITKYTARELNDKKFITDFTNVSTKSQKVTLAWFEKLILDQPELIIIYRKHPVEADSINLNELVKKYPARFYDLNELSVKQWIRVCDIVTTWFSTSIAEIYMAQKPTYLIRPYHIEQEYDVPFYYNAECIDTYKKLLAIVLYKDKQQAFPVSEELIQKYYSIKECPAYKRIVDEIDEIVKNGECRIYEERGFALKRVKFLLVHGRVFKFLIKVFYQFIYIKLGFQIRNDKIRKNYAVNKWEDDIKNKYDKLNCVKYSKMKAIVKQDL